VTAAGKSALSECGISSNLATRRTIKTEGFRFTVDPVRKLVKVRFGKKVAVEEIGRYAMELRGHPAFEPSFSEVVDLRGAEELNLEARDFFALADQLDPFSPEAMRAFVVRTAVQRHAARMHKVLRVQRNIEIFRSLEEAERWIESSI
jgi:hypothetical protein